MMLTPCFLHGIFLYNTLFKYVNPSADFAPLRARPPLLHAGLHLADPLLIQEDRAPVYGVGEGSADGCGLGSTMVSSPSPGAISGSGAAFFPPFFFLPENARNKSMI